MNKLQLFYYDQCPFCQMVLEVVEDLNIIVEYRNILNDKSALNKLVSDTGRRTVPCLYINDKPMFESGDIIDWLKNNKSQVEAKA